MKIVPIRDLKDTVKIEKLCSETNEPVFITKNGYGRLVVMDIAFYEQMLNDMCIAKALQDGLDDIKKGDYEDTNDLIERMRLKYGL